jgi:alkaline phosphatase/alkaline phosphatase D
MRNYLSIISTLLIFISCNSNTSKIYLGQGIMSGEITTNSVILQTRLTVADTLINNDLPGIHGFARFELSTNKNFTNPIQTEFLEAIPENDFIVKKKVSALAANTNYYYRIIFGENKNDLEKSEPGTFKTLPGADSTSKVSFVVVTGMNYYHFHYGNYNGDKAYTGSDKELGYPALVAIKSLSPDYFIGTGDNVYFDHPAEIGFDKAVERGDNPHPGRFGGKEVTNETGMRKKYHVQFIQQRYKDLFANVGTYWEKDDHDYRFNDADPYAEFPISHEQGIKNFREQVPVVDPEDKNAKTYRTYQMSKDAQIWMLEGRDYRSANSDPIGPDKTLLGKEQIEWLKKSLLESEATFKLIVSPTPMVGPDDMYKKDNHVNPQGFKHEGDALFAWFKANNFLEKNVYIICGDRHWKYHAMHPSGFEEFSTGALVDNNSRAGRVAGDPDSTDPNAEIKQFFVEGTPESASGGFLLVEVERKNGQPTATFGFYDEHRKLLYHSIKTAD